jgi:hypothetical protein
LGGSIFGGPFFQTWLRGCEGYAGYAGRVLEEGGFAMRTKVRVLVPVPVVLFCCRGDRCWKMDMSWRGSWGLEFGVERSAEQIHAAGFKVFVSLAFTLATFLNQDANANSLDKNNNAQSRRRQLQIDLCAPLPLTISSSCDTML